MDEENEASCTEHVGEFLPPYVNGTLDPTTRAVVEAHLAHCQGCATEMQTWASIAAAAIRSAERRADATRFESTIGLAATVGGRDEGGHMSAQRFNSMALARQRNTMPIRPSLRKMFAFAAIAAFAVLLGGGATYYRNLGPSNRALEQGAAPASAPSQAACNSVAPSEEQLAMSIDVSLVLNQKIVYVSGLMPPRILTGADELPTSVEVSATDQVEIVKMWNEYQACRAVDVAAAYAFMTSDGIRDAFFRKFIGADLFRGQPWNGSGTILFTTPAAGESSTGGPTIQHMIDATGDGFTLGKMSMMNEGRVYAELIDPNLSPAALQSSYIGEAIFKRENGTWKIDLLSPYGY